jgi:hypothetical protein
MFTLSLQTIVLLLFVPAFALNAPVCAKTQPAVTAPARQGKTSAASRADELRVTKAADHFVSRFRETLDFGLVFDEFSVSDAFPRLRKARLFENIYLSAKMVDSADYATLKRAYQAFMNLYYLKAAYDLSGRPIGGNEQNGDPPLPPDIVAASQASRYLKVLVDEELQDAPYATTREELDQFVAEFERIAALFKKHVPPNFFNSETYKANLQVVNENSEGVHVRDGFERLGIGEGTRVYEITQDLFTFFFIEENGQLKVLTFGLGDRDPAITSALLQLAM